RQIVGLAALGPGFRARRPGVDLLQRVGGLDLVIALLQPRVDEVAGEIGDPWVFGVLGEDHRHGQFAQQIDDSRGAKAGMAGPRPHAGYASRRSYAAAAPKSRRSRLRRTSWSAQTARAPGPISVRARARRN